MNMALPRTSRLLVVLASAALSAGVSGCGGGSAKGSYPDASTSGGGGGGAASGGGHGAMAAGGAGGSLIVSPGSGGSGPAAGGSSGKTGTPPAPGSTPLLSGGALLIGPGPACSSAPATTAGAPPDRWCGLFVPSGNQMIGLAVFNLTKALAGTPITCDTTDVNCLPLNASIDVNSDDTDATYGFIGQTLIYYDATTVYAWRPGWTAGRALLAHSTAQPVQCAAAPSDAGTVICLAGADNSLHAGSLATPTGATLPLVETLANGSTGIDFSPDGLSVVWSVKTSSSATAPAETLKMQAIGDATTKRTIASDITEWAISADGTRWYWLAAPTTDANMITTGALQTAPYPAGTPPAPIQAKVGQYLLYGPRGAITLTAAAAATAPGADMNVIPDVDAPVPAVVEGNDVIGLVGATDSASILYATMAAQPGSASDANSILVDLRLIQGDGTGTCVVAATPSADPGARFNAAGTAVEWVDVKLDASGIVTSVSGAYTTVADCAPHLFTPSLYGFYDVTSGLLFQQGFDMNTFTADIDYAPLLATGAPGAPALVQAGADSTIVPLFPTPGRVLFTLSSGAATDGLYLSPAIAAATPDLAPVRRPVAAFSALPVRPALTPAGARARLATTGLSIPSSIAAPWAISLPLTGQSTSLPFARRARGARSAHLFAPVSRAAVTR